MNSPPPPPPPKKKKKKKAGDEELVKNWDTGDLRHHRALYHVIVMNLSIKGTRQQRYWSDLFLRDGNMMTSSNGNIFRVTGPLCGEFTGHRWIPHTNASDAELWWFLWYKRLSKQSRGWWFETPSCPLRRHCNDIPVLAPKPLTLRLFFTG